MFKKNGFTLAETLLALVIMGVIASLVIPSMIINTKKKEYTAGYQRALNVLNTAYNQYSESSKAQYQTKFREVKNCPEGTHLTHLLGIEFCLGLTDGIQIDPVISIEPYLEKSTDALDPAFIGGELLNSNDLIMNNLIKPNLSIIKTTLDNDDKEMAGCPNDSAYFYTEDGMRYCFLYSASEAINETYADKTYGVMWVDVNGNKGPNEVSRSADKPGDTLPIIMMKDRFIPGHPTDTNASEIAQEIYFGEDKEEEPTE